MTRGHLHRQAWRRRIDPFLARARAAAIGAKRPVSHLNADRNDIRDRPSMHYIMARAVEVSWEPAPQRSTTRDNLFPATANAQGRCSARVMPSAHSDESRSACGSCDKGSNAACVAGRISCPSAEVALPATSQRHTLDRHDMTQSRMI